MGVNVSRNVCPIRRNLSDREQCLETLRTSCLENNGNYLKKV